MADTNYSILVQNKSGVSRAYFIFVEAPTVTNSSKVFQNVYAAAAPVPNGTGTARFNVSSTFYAVTGTSPGRALGSNVSITTGDYEIAKLKDSSKNGSTISMTAGPTKKGAEFVRSLLTQSCTTPGSFDIKTDGSFNLGNGSNQFIGMGAADPFDPSTIVPVATVEAQPNTSNTITPKIVYYISWGTFTSGQIFDVTTVATPAMVDFTGKAATVAKITHNLNGTWDITFN